MHDRSPGPHAVFDILISEALFHVFSVNPRTPRSDDGPPALRQFALVASGVFLVLCCAACATTRPDETSGEFIRDARAERHATEAKLREIVARWDGTPFVFGGEGRRGLDCSAFVQHVYADLYDIHLPRTTDQQARWGAPVKRNELKAGDLVFFRPPKSRHVGVYLSNGEFAHVATSRGVTVSTLEARYWRDSYWTARRAPRSSAALSEEPTEISAPMEASSGPVPPPQVDPGGRVGW